MRISKTLVYFLIMTLVGSIVAYRLVIAGYEKLAIDMDQPFLADVK